ncbi:hypothetical protein J4226_03515 [Candidatus Pacearchaeota archaeon]|nr:hypothetical protein [Candidatus Pacearchaeota archaeon]
MGHKLDIEETLEFCRESDERLSEIEWEYLSSKNPNSVRNEVLTYWGTHKE